MRTTLNTSALRSRLHTLEAERALAEQHGLGENALYLADLDREVAVTRAAYVGAAVTEIATLRGQLNGPLVG